MSLPPEIKAALIESLFEKKQHNEDAYEGMKVAQQKKKLTEYSKSFSDARLNAETLKPGMYIRRNKIGMERYAFPKKNQLMIILDTFLTTQLKEDGINALVAIIDSDMSGEESPRMFRVDLAFYEKDPQSAILEKN